MKDLALNKVAKKEIEKFEKEIAYCKARIEGGNYMIENINLMNDSFNYRMNFCSSEIDRLKRKINENI